MQKWEQREGVTAILLSSLSPVSNKEASPLLSLAADVLAGQLHLCTSHRDGKRRRNETVSEQKRTGDKTLRELNGSMAEGCEDKREDDVRAEQGQTSNDKLFSTRL